MSDIKFRDKGQRITLGFGQNNPKGITIIPEARFNKRLTVERLPPMPLPLPACPLIASPTEASEVGVDALLVAATMAVEAVSAVTFHYRKVGDIGWTDLAGVNDGTIDGVTTWIGTPEDPLEAGEEYEVYATATNATGTSTGCAAGAITFSIEEAEITLQWALVDIDGLGYEGHAFEGVQAGGDPFYGIDGANALKLVSRDVFANSDNLIAGICDGNGDEIHKSSGVRVVCFRAELSQHEIDASQLVATVGFCDDSIDSGNFATFKAVKAGIGFGTGQDAESDDSVIDGDTAWPLNFTGDMPNLVPPQSPRYYKLIIDFTLENVKVYSGSIPAGQFLLDTIPFVPNGPVAVRSLSFLSSEDYDFALTAYVTADQITGAGFTMPGGSVGWADA